MYVPLSQVGESGLGLTQNSWFNSCHGLFSPLTPIINTNTLSLKHLKNILPTFHLNIHFKCSRSGSSSFLTDLFTLGLLTEF